MVYRHKKMDPDW